MSVAVSQYFHELQRSEFTSVSLKQEKVDILNGKSDEPSRHVNMSLSRSYRNSFSDEILLLSPIKTKSQQLALLVLHT